LCARERRVACALNNAVLKMKDYVRREYAGA
jgi:hypothetical protein